MLHEVQIHSWSYLQSEWGPSLTGDHPNSAYAWMLVCSLKYSQGLLFNDLKILLNVKNLSGINSCGKWSRLPMLFYNDDVIPRISQHIIVIPTRNKYLEVLTKRRSSTERTILLSRTTLRMSSEFVYRKTYRENITSTIQASVKCLRFYDDHR